MNKPDEVRNAVDAMLVAVNNDYKEGIEAEAILLLGGAAINLALIAEAVTKLQVGNPDPTKPMSLRDLTDEERETIEGLRDGRLIVTQFIRTPSEIMAAQEAQQAADELERKTMIYFHSNSDLMRPWSDLNDDEKAHWRKRYVSTLPPESLTHG